MLSVSSFIGSLSFAVLRRVLYSCWINMYWQHPPPLLFFSFFFLALGPFLRQGDLSFFQAVLSATTNWSHALVGPNISPMFFSAQLACCIVNEEGGCPSITYPIYYRPKSLPKDLTGPKVSVSCEGLDVGLAAQMGSFVWFVLSGLTMHPALSALVSMRGTIELIRTS